MNGDGGWSDLKQTLLEGAMYPHKPSDFSTKPLSTAIALTPIKGEKKVSYIITSKSKKESEDWIALCMGAPYFPGQPFNPSGDSTPDLGAYGECHVSANILGVAAMHYSVRASRAERIDEYNRVAREKINAAINKGKGKP